MISSELKRIAVDTNWDLMHLGPFILHRELQRIHEGERVIDYMEEDEWIGIVRRTKLISRWSKWYLEIIK